MSIASEITKLKQNLRDSRTSVLKKGGSVATDAGMNALPTAIDSIPSGSQSIVFQEVESNTYMTTVPEISLPEGTIPYARVNKIGGMTYKTRNLIPPPTKSATTVNGITFTPNSDGSVTASGTATADATFSFRATTNEYFELETGKTYTLSGCPSGGGTSTYYVRLETTTYNRAAYDTGNGASITVGENEKWYVFVRVLSGITVNNLVFRPMLNEGLTALAFEPYGELRNAAVTELLSEGANEINYANINSRYTVSGNTISGLGAAWNMDIFTGTTGNNTAVPTEYFDKLPYLTKGAYTVYFDMEAEDESSKIVSVWGVNSDGSLTGIGFTSKTSGTKFTITEDWRVTVRVQDSAIKEVSNLRIVRDVDTFNLPEQVTSLEGYGLGKSATEYNYVDLDNKVFEGDYAKIRLPSNKGAMNVDANWYYISKGDLGISPISRDVLCNLLPSMDLPVNSTYNGIYTSASMSHILIRKPEFTTAAEYQQWLTDNEVYIIERLAEPTETDISKYITDEYIEVEGGGTITAVNEYKYDAPTKLTYISETDGLIADYETGFNIGRQAEYDAFWDSFQDFGTRTSYYYGFQNWAVDNFYPKYDFKPTNTSQMFRQLNERNQDPNFDLAARLEQFGVKLDTSSTSSMDGMFLYCRTVRVPEINTISTSSVATLFQYATLLVTIDKLILKADGSQKFDRTFQGCSNLKNLKIEGTIGQNGFDVSSCTKLSKASWQSIINALSATTSGLTITGSLASVNSAFETSEGANNGSTSTEWTTLKATKSNWIIELK